MLNRPIQAFMNNPIFEISFNIPEGNMKRSAKKIIAKKMLTNGPAADIFPFLSLGK